MTISSQAAKQTILFLELWQINTETLQVCGFPWGGGEWWDGEGKSMRNMTGDGPTKRLSGSGHILSFSLYGMFIIVHFAFATTECFCSSNVTAW